MSQKHKLEEFCDPDYPPEQSAKRKCLGVLSVEERLEKLRAIIKCEFGRELKEKEGEVAEIENRIAICKELLHKVRYAVVAEYYNKNNNKSLQCTENEAIQIQSHNSLFQNESKGPQMAIHPALKEVLAKNPADYEEIIRIRPTREAAKTAKTSIKEKLRTKKEEMQLQRQIKEGGIVIDHSKQNLISETAVVEKSAPIKVPRYIKPVSTEKVVPSLNSSRGSNQFKHLIVVGNTSKYIGNEKSSDHTTHKWLIYVQTKTSVPIEKFVNKVRFFLHSSYRPNDVVDVTTPPYHLARRGWGEFPVRMQFFFDSKLQQKPVQLIHHLVLDKTLSGLQTMGAETLVEIWLRSAHLLPLETPEAIETMLKPEVGNYSKAEIDENLFDFLNKIEETSTECPDIDKIEPTVIDSPIIDSSFTRKALGLPPVISINTALIKLEAGTENSITESSSKIDNSKILQSSEKNIASSGTSTNLKINNCINLTNDKIKPTLPQEEPKIQKIEPLLNKTVTSVSLNRIQVPAKISSSEINQLKVVRPNNILQKKLLKFVDRDGNIKTVQMFVSPSRKSTLPLKPESQNSPLVKNTKDTIEINGKKTHIKVDPNESLSASSPLVAEKLINNQLTNGKSNKIILFNGHKISRIIKAEEKKYQPVSPVTKHTSLRGPELMQNGTLMKPGVVSSTSLELTTSNSTSINTVSSRSTGQLPKKQIFQKNGIMYIIDPIQSKLKQQQKKQESLLKPQLKPHSRSLLPISSKLNSSVIIDHDYTPATVINNQRVSEGATDSSQLIPSSSFHSKKPPNKAFAMMKKPRRNYLLEYETKFHACSFSTIRSAVEYLLRRLTLINVLARDSDFRYCYPFIVASMDEFSKMAAIKQRAVEWLRAKYVSKTIRKHLAFKSSSESLANNNKEDEINLNKFWTTKEIVCFARQHAYTPVISKNSGPTLISFTNSNATTTSTNNSNNSRLFENKPNNEILTDLVKEELNKNRYNCQSVTLCHDIYKWINKTQENISKKLDEDVLVIVDEIDVENTDENDNRTSSNHISPIKFKKQKLWIPVPEQFESEAQLASDMCQEIGIRLQPEEIGNDIVHHSAEIVLAQTLRLFTEDLIRRSIALKQLNDTERESTEHILQASDIVNAINSRNEFDFLTNKHLGIMNIKNSED